MTNIEEENVTSSVPTTLAPTINTTTSNLREECDDAFQWTSATIAQSISLFFFAGVAEIVGGWMIWMTMRGDDEGKRPWWFALSGGIILVIYGFIPTFQPTSNFGRLYAAYGGAFIVMSFLFGWSLDGNKPDIGDIVGSIICLVGAAMIYFWPRSDE
jgi:drug/metabolite transporter superfamily protein YnfA